MKIKLGIFFVLIFCISLVYAGPDDETCTGVKSYSIYEVARAPVQVYHFIGVPGLPDGYWHAEKVTLQYNAWHYGAADDRDSTPAHEDWDEVPAGTYSPHIYKKYSGVVSKHNRDLKWEYRYFLPGGPTTDGFKRYYYKPIISYASGKYELVDHHWWNLPSETDGTLYIELAARGHGNHKESRIDVTYNIYEYSNRYRADNPSGPDLAPKNFETTPNVYATGGGFYPNSAEVVPGWRYVEYVSQNNEYATFKTYYYIVYSPGLGGSLILYGRYPQENDMAITFSASGKFRVLPPTLNSVNNSNTGIITVSGTVGEVTAYPQTIRFYVDGVYDSSSTITVPANISNFSKDFSFEGEGTHTIYSRAVGRSGHESRDSNTVSAIVDTIPPEIKNFNVSRNLIGPQSSSETFRTTTITANVVDEHPYTWKVEIKLGDTLVREYTGSGTSISAVWDGKDTGGNVVASGNYNVYVTAIDLAGNDSVRSVTDDFNTPPEPNKFIWTECSGGSVSTVTTSGITVESGKLNIHGFSTGGENNFGTMFLRSNVKVNFEGGLTVKVQMLPPANPNGNDSASTVFSEFYIHDKLLESGTTQPQLHDVDSYIRMAVRSSGGLGVPNYHWLLQRRLPGYSQPGWLLTTFPDSITGSNLSSGTWTVNIQSTTITVQLVLADGQTYEASGQHGLDFTSAYLYYALRTESTTNYAFSSDYVWTSVEPTWSNVAVDNNMPAVVSVVTGISGYYPGYVNLQWTSPGDDGTAGTVSAYETRYNTYNISGDTATWWNNATVLNQNWPSADNDKIVTGLTPGVTYYFVLRGRDDVWNLSDMPTNACSVVASTQNLVYINEVMPATYNPNYDWFELKKEWGQTINLENWKFYTIATDIKWTGTTNNQILSNNLFVSPQSLNLSKSKSTTFYIENNFGDIVDKIILGEQVDTGSYSRFIYENKILYETDPTPTYQIENTVSNATVKINEVRYKSGPTEPWGSPPANQTLYEFIELYNTGTTTEPLIGWSLRNKSENPFFLPVFKILPQGFNSINAGSYGHASSTNIVAGDTPSLSYINAFKYGASNGLTNTADFVVFENPAGQTVDRVTWGDPGVYYSSTGVSITLTNPAPVVGNDGYSIGRASDVIPGSSYDTDTDGIDFSTMTVPIEISQNANSGLATANDLISPSSSTSLSGSFDVTIKLGANSSDYPTDTLTFSVAKDGGNDIYSPHIFQLSNLGFNLTLYGSTQTVAMDSGSTDINGNQLADSVTYYVILNTDMDDAGPRKSAPVIINSNVYYKRVGPAQITNLSATAGTDEGTITLNWTAPGADGTIGTAAEYDLRKSTNAIISLDDFLNSTRINISNPLSPGSNEQVLVTGLLSNTLYYFRMRTKNDSIWTGLSNSTSTVSQKDNIAPNTITDLNAVSDLQIKLLWTSPGDDGTVGTASSYVIKYSTVSITAGNWGSSMDITNEPIPLVSRSTQSFVMTGLVPQTTYWFAIRSLDDSGNMSSFFNSVSAISGRFYCSEVISAEYRLTSICLGDIDGDNKLDMVSGIDDGLVSPQAYSHSYKNDGTGFFISLSTIQATSVFYSGLCDIDNDGDLDLIATDDNELDQTAGYYIFKNENNTGVFSFSQHERNDSTQGTYYPGDIDNDGDMDFAMSENSTMDWMHIYQNQNLATGNYISHQILAFGDTSASIVLCDIDNDGVFEMIIGCPNNGDNSRIYENNNSYFVFKSSFNDNWNSVRQIAVADVNLDGNMDLIFATTNSGVKIYLNDGSGNFNLSQSLNASYGNFVSVAMGDINNDGYIDLVAGQAGDPVEIYKNDGTGNFILNESFPYDSTYGRVVVGDIDSDGDLDLVEANQYSPSEIRVYKNMESIQNTEPQPPQNYSSEFSTATEVLTLKWGNGSDAETTNTNGLFYNVKIGTTPNGREVASELYGSPLIGNYIRPKISASQLGIYLKNLSADTTYYWRIQTIDTGLLAGDWSDYQIAFTGVPPSAITDFVATQSSSAFSPGDVDLTWTAPGDDGTVGTASYYVVKFASFNATSAGGATTWFNLAQTAPSFAPQPPDYQDGCVVTGLTEGVTYYFAIKVGDEANNLSPISNESFSIPMTYRSLVFNEIAPSQNNGEDILEFYVAKAGNYGGYKVYENANSTGTELVKVFPSTGVWSGEIPIGTYILLHFSTGTADETSITNNIINIYTDDSGLDASDNLLYLSDSGGITFTDGVYQSGKIIDFVVYANQDLTELSSVYQTNIATATLKGQWDYETTVLKQFDCVNSRGLISSSRAIARNENSEKYGYKGDWSYRTSLSTGAVNPPSTTAGGLGTASIYQSSSVVVNSTGTWKIEYKASDPTYSNEGHIVTIDIPSGWTTPQTTDPYSAGYTTTTFSFPSGYVLSVITGIEGVAGRIMFPVGQLTSGATVSIIYGDTTTSANGCATVQSSSGTAMFAVSSDDTGTNTAELMAGSPGLQVTGGGGGAAPRFAGLNADFVKGEIYSFPNPAKRGKRPTIHIECGVADKVEIRIYNIAAELVDSAELYGIPPNINNKYAYEYNWDISDIASGVYIYTIRAKKAGYSDIKATGKCAIIK